MHFKFLTFLSVIPLENLGMLENPAEAAGLKVISTGCIKQAKFLKIHKNKKSKNIL